MIVARRIPDMCHSEHKALARRSEEILNVSGTFLLLPNPRDTPPEAVLGTARTDNSRKVLSLESYIRPLSTGRTSYATRLVDARFQGFQ